MDVINTPTLPDVAETEPSSSTTNSVPMDMSQSSSAEAPASNMLEELDIDKEQPATHAEEADAEANTSAEVETVTAAASTAASEEVTAAPSPAPEAPAATESTVNLEPPKGVDPSFLAALPEETSQEIIAEKLSSSTTNSVPMDMSRTYLASSSAEAPPRNMFEELDIDAADAWLCTQSNEQPANVPATRPEEADAEASTSAEVKTVTPAASTAASEEVTAVPSPAPAATESTVNPELPEGLDPSFLAALPEEMQQKVIAEQLRLQRIQQRARSNVNTGESESSGVFEVDPEFLAALPPDIQEEVLTQQWVKQQRQAAAAANPNDLVDASAFSQNLPPTLRQTAHAERPFGKQEAPMEDIKNTEQAQRNASQQEISVDSPSGSSSKNVQMSSVNLTVKAYTCRDLTQPSNEIKITGSDKSEVTHRYTYKPFILSEKKHIFKDLTLNKTPKLATFEIPFPHDPEYKLSASSDILVRKCYDTSESTASVSIHGSVDSTPEPEEISDTLELNSDDTESTASTSTYCSADPMPEPEEDSDNWSSDNEASSVVPASMNTGKSSRPFLNDEQIKMRTIEEKALKTCSSLREVLATEEAVQQVDAQNVISYLNDLDEMNLHEIVLLKQPFIVQTVLNLTVDSDSPFACNGRFATPVDQDQLPLLAKRAKEVLGQMQLSLFGQKFDSNEMFIKRYKKRVKTLAKKRTWNMVVKPLFGLDDQSDSEEESESESELEFHSAVSEDTDSDAEDSKAAGYSNCDVGDSGAAHCDTGQ